MEATHELQTLYEKAKSAIEKIGDVNKWEKSDRKFVNDPPCIVALLTHGIFELGSINSAQFRLAAYLKVSGQSISECVNILDNWLREINPRYIYEDNLTTLEEQNRYVAKTVYASSEYGFSCPGIKQIPGVSEHCDKKCEDDLEETVSVSLFDASRAEYRHRRIGVHAECIGRMDNVFIIPKVVTAECIGRTVGGKKCASCPLYGSSGSEVQFEVSAASNHILNFLEPSRMNLAGKIAAMVGIPRTDCHTWKWRMTEQNAERIYIVPPIVNELSEASRHTRQEAYFVGHGTQTNQAYQFSGYSHLSANSNIVKLVFDTKEETVDSLTDFNRTTSMVEDSKLFQVGDMSPMEKYDDIIASLTYNHIKIWGRDAMIIAMDLAFHSVRRINFQRNTIRGWIDLLVIGDSGQGKTRAVTMLMEHYGLGYRASAEGCTRAGLIWGVDVKKDSNNCLIWGTIPRHTGRLVVIDELKNLIEKGHFAELTDVRSSGMVSVDTIVSGKASAETRLILMTNPPPRMFMGSYSYPVEAILDLIPDPEDTRRFDMVVGVASNEIADEVIHQNIDSMFPVEDTYSADICKNHLLWVWNLHPEDVVISGDVEKTTLELSLEMCKTYSSMIPIVEPADQREKLIRVGTAFAARLNCVTANGKLEVQEIHVEAAKNFMDTLYQASALQYDTYSKVHARIDLNLELIDKLKGELQNQDWAPYWRRILWHIMEDSFIQPKVVAVVADCQISIVSKLLNWCVAYKLCKMTSKGSYVKTPNGVTFFRKVLDEELGKLEGTEKYTNEEGDAF